jgi:hypothetical protein
VDIDHIFGFVLPRGVQKYFKLLANFIRSKVMGFEVLIKAF